MKQKKNSGSSHPDLFESSALAGLAGSGGVASATKTAGADDTPSISVGLTHR